MFDIYPKLQSRNGLISIHYSYSKANIQSNTWHHILKVIHCRGIGYHLNAISLKKCPKTLILRKTTTNPKGNKPFLDFSIMYLTKCSSIQVRWHNFPILAILKDLNLNNILHLPLNFYLELSKLLDLDKWQYPYIIFNEQIVIYLQDLRASTRFLCLLIHTRPFAMKMFGCYIS